MELPSSHLGRQCTYGRAAARATASTRGDWPYSPRAVETVGTFASRWPVLRPGQLHAWLRRSPREKKSTRAVTDAQEHPSVSCSPVSGTTDLCIHTETTMRKMKMRCHYSAARKRNVKRMKMKSSENVRKRKR